jgi:mannosyltransferase OCH1-like enzyme
MVGEMVSKSAEVEPSTEIKTGFQADGEIHKLIHFIWNKEELPDKWKSPLL